jgi:hypothetical protein
VFLRVKLDPDRDSEEKLRIDGLERLLRFCWGARAPAGGIEGCTENSGFSGVRFFFFNL